ncbi:MAG: imidazole glycerol phosphate synthase subunit HisF [Gemmatimonadetes bacterium]|nr:imidazole glycerol phosphate synthase subunit HisF [Gemmatimonadota bacterium]
MLAARIIPCLDVRDGTVVKGVRFQGLREMGDPVELAAAYESSGADELVVLDVSATSEGRAASLAVVRAVREVLSIPLTVGGGVRSIRDVEDLLGAGADKVAVNSAAARRPGILDEMAGRFGSQCTILSLDARWNGADYAVVTHAGTVGTERAAASWASEAEKRGAGEVLLTSWDRDGTRTGYDLRLLRDIRRAVRIPVIASGGASTAEHFLAAFEAGADAVLAASMFHEKTSSILECKHYLANAKARVRL